MAEWGRRVFGGALLGAALGVAVGLLLARWLWPPVVPVATPTATPPPPTVATPAEEEVQEEALLVIAALYALDGDATRAQERLSALGLDDPAAAVGELALRQAAAGNEQVATDLATLAAALGRESAELLAYVATATPTATPTPTVTPTATPTPTFTPTPTPTPTATPSPRPTHRPAAKPPTATAAPPPRPTPLELEWDYRASMLSPPVKLVEAQVAPGERYWKLVKMEWRKPSEGGNTLIYISTLDEYGRPLYGQPVVIEHGPQEVVYTQPGADYGANYPMANTLNSYIVFIGGELPSDRVTGLGLGEWYGGMDHTSFILVFQRTRK